MIKPAMFAATALATMTTLTGCHNPSGGIFSSSGGSQTYYSTELMQKTITMKDVRNGNVFFAIDIPPGKQLTFDFEAAEGDDSVNTPDLLRWEIMEQGTQLGRLHNAMTVPNAASRRIDVTLQRGVQYAADDPLRPLRTDEVADRPDWWTAKGGPVPKDQRTGMYDH